ncbi:MAG TPA: hypothetical protein VGU01_12885 [Sphingomicrobium sp.]|nr:hypothetical protein [Sphingomicrobium sp.]
MLAANRDAAATVLLAIIFILALPLAFASSPKIFNDGDVSWHIAAGQWILAHGGIPTTDPFSYSAAGQSWVVTEWLADAIFGFAYRLAGYSGASVVVAASFIALHAFIFSYLQRRVGPIAIAATLLVMDFVLIPFVLARPHILVWPLLAAWTILLLKAEEEGRAPPIWATLILCAWTNIHGSFLIAAPIAAAIALDALQKTKWRNWREWAWFATASLVGILLNANGLRGLLRPFQMENLAILPMVQEWQPSTLQWMPQFYAALAVGMFALLYQGIRVPVGRLLLLIALAGLAFSQVRHQSWFIIVAACVVPPLLSSQASRAASWRWLVVATIPLLLLRGVLPITPAENAANPRQLIAAVPASLQAQPMFNSYTFGGPLILAGMHPYIDGRADMYGDAFVLNYSRIMDGDVSRFDAAVRRYGIRWTMLPTNSVLAQMLDRSPEWKRIYVDRVGTIHVRQD